MKIPKFFAPKRKKLRATTARRSMRIAATADYDEMAEPNMKLSRALLIVLVLHVVAVSGIIAFNAIKTRQNSSPPPASIAAGFNASVASRPGTDAPTSQSAAPKETTRRDDSKPAHSPGRSVAKDDKKSEHKANVATSDPGKIYVVAKGDNPVTIAKKLKVSYDELLALNHIDDPHKLQIGQKLMIPGKTAKGKKTDE